VIFGGTVGVGILRMPGTIAAQLPNVWMILAVWVVGGLYALLGAVQVAELGAAIPLAGGFYVYSRRAFGPAAGFAMGWADWLNNCAVVAYGAVAASEYVTSLMPGSNSAHVQTAIALGLLAVFCGLHWFGLRLSSGVQKLTSSLTAATFVVLAVACLLHSGSRLSEVGGAARPVSVMAMLVPLVAALRAIVVTYDGWYEAIYFTEEDTNAAKHLPRAMIGGVLLVMGLYLLMNVAFLHVLSIPELANSKLAAADAARIVFPAWSGNFVTVLSLLTLLSLMHAVLLGAPRILFAIGRDGLFRGVAKVGPGGTPRAALLVSAGTVALFIVSGRFDDIIAVAAILVAAMYCVNYVAVMVLRVREPEMMRPFRAWGYPITTALVLLGSVAFLLADVREDPVSAVRAAVLLVVALPVYWWTWVRAKKL
jgi:basic amino acid/polyamine antiporter, APA family